MLKKILLFTSFFILLCSIIAYANEEAPVPEKNETTIPLTTMSPPEGNTTFMGGTAWCIALPDASQTDLQIALDWACGSGNADCGPIQAGGPCFEPNTLVSHASYAFNSYYQQNGNNEVACHFGGTATLTQHDPSYGKCVYAASRPTKSESGKLDAKFVIRSLTFETHNGAESHAKTFTSHAFTEKDLYICPKQNCVLVVTVVDPTVEHQCLKLKVISSNAREVIMGY